MKKKILECINIKQVYKKNRKNLTVIRDVNYSFFSNTFYAICGKSGAGKTTLINILGLLNKPSGGEIILSGVNTNELNENKISEIRNRKIGFIFQSYYLNPLMTAEENIYLPMLINKDITQEQMLKKTSELLSDMSLADRKKHFPKELSGGEQQRVAIARALANNPDIILADEPTGSLDPENEKKVLSILKKLSKQGKCVIVVTHSNIVKKYADIVLEIENKNLKELKK